MGVTEDIEGQLERGLSKVKEIAEEKSELTDTLGNAAAHFYACGYTFEKISELLHLDLEYLKLLFETETMNEAVEAARREVFSGDSKSEFRALSPRAAKIINQIMASPTERGATRLQAAMYAIDRAHGKPTQSLDVGGSMIKEFIKLLDDQKRTAIDISTKIPNNVEDAEVIEAPTSLSEVDSWFQKGGSTNEN